MLRLVFLALIVVAVVSLWRHVAARRSRSGRVDTLGLDPDAPLRVTWANLRDYVDSQVCSCGGRLKSFGEGPREHGGRRLHAVVAECERCEEQYTVYFAESDDNVRPAKEPPVPAEKVVPFRRPESRAEGKVVPFRRPS